MGKNHIRSPQDGLLASIPAHNNVVPVLSDGLRHSPLSEMAGGAALKKDVQKKIVKPGHCLPELHISDGSLKAYLADADTASGQARDGNHSLPKHLGISTLRFLKHDWNIPKSDHIGYIDAVVFIGFAPFHWRSAVRYTKTFLHFEI